MERREGEGDHKKDTNHLVTFLLLTVHHFLWFSFCWDGQEMEVWTRSFSFLILTSGPHRIYGFLVSFLSGGEDDVYSLPCPIHLFLSTARHKKKKGRRWKGQKRWMDGKEETEVNRQEAFFILFFVMTGG